MAQNIQKWSWYWYRYCYWYCYWHRHWYRFIVSQLAEVWGDCSCPFTNTPGPCWSPLTWRQWARWLKSSRPRLWSLSHLVQLVHASQFCTTPVLVIWSHFNYSTIGVRAFSCCRASLWSCLTHSLPRSSCCALPGLSLLSWYLCRYMSVYCPAMCSVQILCTKEVLSISLLL